MVGRAVDGRGEPQEGVRDGAAVGGVQGAEDLCGIAAVSGERGKEGRVRTAMTSVSRMTASVSSSAMMIFTLRGVMKP